MLHDAAGRVELGVERPRQKIERGLLRQLGLDRRQQPERGQLTHRDMIDDRLELDLEAAILPAQDWKVHVILLDAIALERTIHALEKCATLGFDLRPVAPMHDDQDNEKENRQGGGKP